MTIATITIGSSPNDGTGEPLRDALTKMNGNFALLGGRTDTKEAYLGWHTVAVPTAAVHQIVNGDLTTTVDPDGFWSAANDRLEVPAGYSEILIVFNGGIPGASTGGFDYAPEVWKNATGASYSTGSTAEPTAWSDVQATASLSGTGNDVCGLVIRDQVATGDTYRFFLRHDKGSDATSAGNLLAVLIP